MKKELNQMESFGEKLKKIRFEKSLTQIELSRISGITNVQIARYENNTAKPSMIVLKKLSKALEMNVEKLAVDFFKTEFTIDDLDVSISRMKQLPQNDILVIKEVIDRFVESREVRSVVINRV